MGKILGIGWDVGGWCGNSQGISFVETDESNGEPRLIQTENNPSEISFDLLDSSRIPPNPVQFFSEQFTVEFDFERYDRRVLAIDAPLTFPQGFREFLSDNKEGIKETWDLESSEHIQNPYFYRNCERWIKDTFDKKPQPAVGSWIGNNATVAQLLVNQWRDNEQWVLCPQDDCSNDQNAIIEVYPGTLKTKSGEKSLKKPFQKIVNDPESLDIGIDDDPYDAYLCALHGLAFQNDKLSEKWSLTGYSDQKNSNNNFPREEGWIYTFEQAQQKKNDIS